MVPHFFVKSFTSVSGDICRVLLGVSNPWLFRNRGHRYEIRCKYRSGSYKLWSTYVVASFPAPCKVYIIHLRNTTRGSERFGDSGGRGPAAPSHNAEGVTRA